MLVLVSRLKLLLLLDLQISLIDLIIMRRPLSNLSRMIIINIHAHIYWCLQTKVLAISSPNLPTPPPDYFHLRLEDRMEAWRQSLCGFVKTWPVKLMM
jgi:hypothetical protein